MQTKVLVPNLPAVHQQSLKAGELLPPGHFQEFSTKPAAPVKVKALGQIMAVAWESLQGLLQLPLATLFPNAWCCLPAQHSPRREGLCPGEAAQGSQGSRGQL